MTKKIDRRGAFTTIDHNCRSALLLLMTVSSRAGAAKTVHPVRQAAHAKDAILALEEAMLLLSEARSAAEELCK